MPVPFGARPATPGSKAKDVAFARVLVVGRAVQKPGATKLGNNVNDPPTYCSFEFQELSLNTAID